MNIKCMHKTLTVIDYAILLLEVKHENSLIITSYSGIKNFLMYLTLAYL